jgi:hypothetical protein
MQALSEAAQLGKRVIGFGDELMEVGLDATRTCGVRRGEHLELDCQRHDALLDAVVQIALDLLARLVGGADDPRPRRHQLLPALSVVAGDGAPVRTRRLRRTPRCRRLWDSLIGHGSGRAAASVVPERGAGAEATTAG